MTTSSRYARCTLFIVVEFCCCFIGGVLSRVVNVLCFGNLMFIHLLFSAIIIWHGVW